MRNPFGLTSADWRRAAMLGLLMAGAYLAVIFGEQVYRYGQMAAALAEIDECQTEDACIEAYENFERLKGKK